MSWKIALILSVGLLVLGAIALAALLTGEDGMIVGSVLAIVASTLTAVTSYFLGRRKERSIQRETQRRESTQDP